MPPAVSRQECDALSFQGPYDDCIRGIAEGSANAHFFRVRKAFHRIQPAATNDSDAHGSGRMLRPRFWLGGHLLHITSTNSAWSNNLERCDFNLIVPHVQARGGHFWIVREKRNRPGSRDFRNPFAFVLECS